MLYQQIIASGDQCMASVLEAFDHERVRDLAIAVCGKIAPILQNFQEGKPIDKEYTDEEWALICPLFILGLVRVIELWKQNKVSL